MNKKRRSECTTTERPVLDLDTFNVNDPATYDGTETLRGMNKFTKPFFEENQVAIKQVSKTFQGKTLVVDRDGVRYWLKKKDMRLEEAMSNVSEVRSLKEFFDGNYGVDLDMLSNDEPKDGPGLAYIYEGDDEYRFKIQMYQNRIKNIEEGNEGILDELAAGKAECADTNDQKEAIEIMLGCFHYQLPENYEDIKVYVVPDYKSAIELMKAMKEDYLFLMIQRPSEMKQFCEDAISAEEEPDIEDDEPDDIQDFDEEAVAVHQYVIDEYSVLYKGEYYKCEKVFEVSSGFTDYKVSLDGKVINDDNVVAEVTGAVYDLTA